MPLSAISCAGHLVTAIVGANDGDDRSNACVMLSHELESLLELQFRGKSVDRVNAAEDWRRLEKKVMQSIKKVQRCPRTSRATESVCSASTTTGGSFWTGSCEHVWSGHLGNGVSRVISIWRWCATFNLRFVKPRCPSWNDPVYAHMRDELVYDVPGMDEYQASERARWSSHVCRRVFGCRWNSAARCLAGGCARCRCGLYWACKKCKTKVDQETGCCKKQSTHGCATEQEDSRTILATVHLWLIGQGS